MHRFGDGAGKHIVAVLSVARDAFMKEHMGGALALTDCKEAREFFATKQKDKVLGKLAKAYLGA